MIAVVAPRVAAHHDALGRPATWIAEAHAHAASARDAPVRGATDPPRRTIEVLELGHHAEASAKPKHRCVTADTPTPIQPAIHLEIRRQQLAEGPIVLATAPVRRAEWADRLLGKRVRHRRSRSAFDAVRLEKPPHDTRYTMQIMLPSRATGDITSNMTVSAVAHLAVPTGTAAATVVAREPFADEAIESRRFARLEALPDIAFRANFEELVVSGVYTVLHGRLLVLRVIGGGTRRFAVVASVTGAANATAVRAGLDAHPPAICIEADRAIESGLQTIVETESRQRPVFHGTTPDGVTYTGFAVLHAEALLEALRASAGASVGTGGLTVFVIGGPLELPPGLAVGLERASE